MASLPEAATAPQLTIKPYGAEVFTDLERGKEFVTLYYRHKQAGGRDQQWALVLAVLDDLTAAGLIVGSEGMEIKLSPQIPALGQVQTPATPYCVHIKVAVTPQAQEQAAAAQIVSELRAQFGNRKKGSADR